MNNEKVQNIDNNTACVNASEQTHPGWYNLKYTLVGILFGIVFVKAEIISWFRIQEMFRLQSFHMYGVIGTAVVVGAISVFLIKKTEIAPTTTAVPITPYMWKLCKRNIS